MIKLTEAELVIHSVTRRSGFIAAVKSTSTQEGGRWAVEPETWMRLTREYIDLSLASSSPAIAEPTIVELAQNFAGAITRWVSAGAPVASREDYAARAKICDACEFWDGSARFGLGKCNAPGCNCTSLKRWLATEKCPLGKWPALKALGGQARNETPPRLPAARVLIIPVLT